jgi:hypothetical protein
MTRTLTTLGVDPAFRKNGFGVCAYDLTERTARFLRFTDPIAFYDWIRSDDAPDPETTVVCIENSNMQEQTFARHRFGSVPMQLARSRDVGKNMAVSQMCVNAARRRYPRVLELSPEQKGKKWTPDTFRAALNGDRVTVIGKEPTQDEIDAYQLARAAANPLTQQRAK